MHREQGTCLIRANAFVLLIMYALFLLQPALPYVDYVIRKDFIIEKLCINKNAPEQQCNGKCHLEKQIRNNTDGADESKVPTVPTNEKKECQEYFIKEWIDSRQDEVKLPKGSIYQGSYTFQYVPSIFHPPMQG